MAQSGKKQGLSLRARAWAVLIVCTAMLGVTSLAAWLGVGEHSPGGSESYAASLDETQKPSAIIFDDVALDSGRGVQLHATVCVPDCGENWPLVVLCHGFLGDRNANGHFPGLAEALAQAGIATIRPDFSGCGQSEETFEQYTLAHMTSDMDTCIAYMAANFPIDTETIGLVGHSMGGRLVSLYLGGAGQYEVDAAALWSPANGDGLHGAEFLDIGSFEHVEQMAEEAAANGTVEGWGVSIGKDYFTGMIESYPNQALTNTGIPLLLCYTANEGIISDETQQQTIAAVQAHPGNQVVLEPWGDAGHNYIAFDPDRAAELDPQLDATLRELTVSFLTENLC